MFSAKQASVFTLDHIKQTLAQHEPDLVTPGKQTRQAAVAMVMREADNGPEILFIKRAEQEGDPWSGHMAFPGGHKESSDESLEHAARRETWEEIGLSLDNSVYLGALDHHRAQPRGRVLDMLIAPHVYEIQGDPTFNLNYEVAEVVWAPLPIMANNSLHDTETKPMAGQPTIFNGYRLAQGQFVWGLTYKIVKTFFSTLDPRWDPPREL